MTTKTSFGQWLKQRRKALALSREELAQRIGCAVVTLNKIEAGERRPSIQIADLLAEHLNIPVDERASFVRFARAQIGESDAPWGTPFHPPTNVQVQPTPLIGREQDVVAARKRLLQAESRLLTFIGPPGIGKTRLALQAASVLLDDFADGVFFVTLAPIGDAKLVPATIADTLGVREFGPQPPLERLKAFLRDKQTLLALDNFEQILDAAPSIAELLAACPWLKLLVTSRAPLRIRPERQFPVSPLEVPDLAHLPDVEDLTHYSAIRLFVERAQAVKPDFSVTADNAATVAAICAKLDGLPLAIELISARVKLLSPPALLERLHGRLMLQSDGLRDIEPRHRTLNAAIEWSYQLLSADEQTLFRRLGVFVGGWTLEAAHAICVEGLTLDILDGLGSLLDKNLVKPDTIPNGEPRFTMLETIREYALERAKASVEFEDLRKRHADYFTAFAERTETEFRTDNVRWVKVLQAEHDNFRMALAWSDTGLQLAVALHEFWRRCGHLSEGMGWLTQVLARSKNLSNPAYRKLRAQALRFLATDNHWHGDLDAAQPLHEESLALFRELGETLEIAWVLSELGMLFELRGDYERAGALFEESLTLQRQIQNTHGTAWALFFLGILVYTQGPA